MYVRETVIAHLNRCAEETLALIEFLLQVEKEPSTKNVYYFKDYRRNFFAFYKGIFNCGSNSDFVERVQRRVDQPPGFTEALGIIIANLSKIGFHDVNPLQLTVLQASEDADGAIKIMADVRAYFQGTCSGLFLLKYPGWSSCTDTTRCFQWRTSGSPTTYPRQLMNDLSLELRGVCRVPSQQDWDSIRLMPTKSAQNCLRSLYVLQRNERNLLRVRGD